MNTPNPLIPQGSLQQNSSGKSTVRVAVFTIVAIHAVFITGLLMQGCGRDSLEAENKSSEATNALSGLGKLTNEYYSSEIDLPSVLGTNGQPPVNNLLAQPVAQRLDTSAPSPSSLPPELPASLPPVQLPQAMPKNQAAQNNVAPPPVQPAAPKEYTIVSGDSFYRIAGLHDISVAELQSANPGVDPRRIQPGQKVVIPSGSNGANSGAPSTKSSPASIAVSNGNAEYHVVRARENLTRIAAQHGTTVKALRAVNNLKSDRLSVGQKLKLPQPARSASSGLSASNTVGSGSAVR